MTRLSIQHFLRLSIAIPLCAILMTVPSAENRIQAQATPIRWDAPTTLLETTDLVDPPLLLSDRAGRLHLFWNQRALDASDAAISSAIFYRRYDNGEWTAPIDLIAPGGIYLSGTVDEYGFIHLLYNDLTGSAKYVRSTVVDVGSANDMTEPIAVEKGTQTAADLFVDGENIQIVFGQVNGQISYIQSVDFGETWEPTTEITSLTFGEAVRGGVLEVAQDDSGSKFVAWSGAPVPDNYPPTTTEVSFSSAEGVDWSAPALLTNSDFLAFDVLATGDGEVHLLNVGRAGVGGRYLHGSYDGGQTWSEAITLAESELGTGLSGGSLAIDSTGTIHAVFGLDNRESDATNTTITHTMGRGTNWSPQRDISAGSAGQKELMQIAITHGNEIHVVWRILGKNFGVSDGIGYVYGRLDAPKIQPVEFSPWIEPKAMIVVTTPEAANANATEETRTIVEIASAATALPTGTTNFNRSNPQIRSGLVNSPQAAMMASVGLAAGLVGLVLLGRTARRRR